MEEGEFTPEERGTPTDESTPSRWRAPRIIKLSSFIRDPLSVIRYTELEYQAKLARQGTSESQVVTPTIEPGTTTPTAQRFDETSRTFAYRGDGSPRTTAPTAEGLARAQEATPPAPPTGQTQGK